MVSQLEGAIAMLAHERSPKRRSAARQLRKLKDPSAGPALLTALRKEVKDKRTWETQYQMIMALAECDYKPALPHLYGLLLQHFEATAVYDAIGYAIVCLAREYQDDPRPILALMERPEGRLALGAFLAMAMQRIKPPEGALDKILNFVSGRCSNPATLFDTYLCFYTAMAAAGWSGPGVEEFLQECAASSDDQVQQAAVAAQQKKYLRWRPL